MRHVYSWLGGDGRIHYVDATPEGPMLTISGEFIKGGGPAAGELLRLAEENAALRKTALLANRMTIQEAARIRRELLAELEGVKHIARENFLPMIDRIVPADRGEG